MSNNWWRRIRNKLQNPTDPSSITTSSTSPRHRSRAATTPGGGLMRLSLPRTFTNGYTMHSGYDYRNNNKNCDYHDDYEPNPFSDVGGLLSNHNHNNNNNSTSSSTAQQPPPPSQRLADAPGKNQQGDEPLPHTYLGSAFAPLPSSSQATIPIQWPLRDTALPPPSSCSPSPTSQILPSPLPPQLPSPPAAARMQDEKKPIFDEEYSSLSLAQAQAQMRAERDSGQDASCRDGLSGIGNGGGGGLIEQYGSRLRPMRLAFRRNS
ncbi:hypothetical protein BD289DRAFT_440062 [Coniella lustricola]|uniref:Uncharacterized protein n=1 Tax=Coniella lustricola TaxID=2025994 RepID=A0A2T3A114_9PEZI|nr:hypothetical protein BD289DRAFT_440062 [Coniella lustricola]